MTDRELDSLVAEKVCGWMRIYDGTRWSNPDSHPLANAPTECPAYSTSGDGLLLVIEAMRKKEWSINLLDHYDEWEAQGFVWGDKAIRVSECDPSAPRAVCLAALRALGVEVK